MIVGRTSMKRAAAVGKRRFDSRFYPRKFADKNVEDRREKDAEKCHSEHPREDGCPERLTHLGAGSAAEHEWYYACDECKECHPDLTQTELVRLDPCRVHILDW